MFNGAAVLSVKVFRFDYTERSPVFVLGRDYHSLSFRFSGRVTVAGGGSEFISTPGCITFVPKGLGYTTEIIESGSMIAVHFTMTDEAEGIIKPFVYKVDNYDIFAKLFGNLFESFCKNNNCDFDCFSQFYSILSRLSREIESSGVESVSDLAKDVREYINCNFSDWKLSVGLLSNKFGISEVYLRREFKKAFSLSPIAYIKKVRFDNAKAMLETGYYTVGEVSSNCGFSSPAYFSYAFHHEFGISPSDYISFKL